ncbi:unnamed protein product, partial [Owenia fusiformis]
MLLFCAVITAVSLMQVVAGHVVVPVPQLRNIAKTVGEGPHWDDVTKTLMFVDIDDYAVIWWSFHTKKVDRFRTDIGPISLIVPRRSGGYVITIGRQLYHLHSDRQTLRQALSEEVEANTTNRFNDGKCDPQGRLWVGTMDTQMEKETFERLNKESGNLYRLDTNLTLTKMVERVTVSNGLAWSKDRKTMYYIDTETKNVYAFDYDDITGDIG